MSCTALLHIALFNVAQYHGALFYTALSYTAFFCFHDFTPNLRNLNGHRIIICIYCKSAIVVIPITRTKFHFVITSPLNFT